VLLQIEARGYLASAHRIKQTCGAIFHFAIATSHAVHDPSYDLRGALPPPQSRHLSAITDPAEAGALMRAIANYRGSFVVRAALRLAALTFVPPGELRRAEWTEFDLDGALWRISAHKMKRRQERLVPPSRQAVEILRELHPLTGAGRFVFPSLNTRSRSTSENAVTAALRRMNYEPGVMTAHGFRTMASTLLNEMGWPPDAIERQLADAERNRVRTTYNRAEYLDARR